MIPSPNREAQASSAITSGGADTATVSSQSGSTAAASEAVATTRSWQPPAVRTHGTRVEDEGSAGRAKSSAVAILRGQQRHAALARSRGIAAGLALNASPPRTSSPGACGVLLTQCSRRMCGSDTGLWSMLCCCVCWAPWLCVCTMRRVAAWATRAASTLGAGLGPMLVPPSSPPFVPTAAAAALRGKQLVRVCHGRVPRCLLTRRWRWLLVLLCFCCCAVDRQSLQLTIVTKVCSARAKAACLVECCGVNLGTVMQGSHRPQCFATDQRRTEP